MRLLKQEELLLLDKEPLVEIILQRQEQVQVLTKRAEDLESRLNKSKYPPAEPEALIFEPLEAAFTEPSAPCAPKRGYTSCN